MKNSNWRAKYIPFVAFIGFCAAIFGATSLAIINIQVWGVDSEALSAFYNSGFETMEYFYLFLILTVIWQMFKYMVRSAKMFLMQLTLPPEKI